jgi:hypothetical protein
MKNQIITGCVFFAGMWILPATVRADILFDEQFNSDVFGLNLWDRTDSTVAVDLANGRLHIGSDGGYDDAASKLLDVPVPLVIETRARLVSGGLNYRLPHFHFYFDTTNSVFGNENTNNVFFTVDNGAWTFGYYPTFQNAGTGKLPSGENIWMTIRIEVTRTGGSLYAKFDSDGAFTFVNHKSWNIGARLKQIRLRQPWDATCDIDYIRVTATQGIPPHLQQGLTCASNSSNCLLDLFTTELLQHLLDSVCLGLALDASQVPDQLCEIRQLESEGDHANALLKSFVAAIDLIDSGGSCFCTVVSGGGCAIFGTAIPFLLDLHVCINDLIDEYNASVCRPGGNPVNCLNQGLINNGYSAINVEVLSPVTVKITDADGNALGVSQTDNLPYSELQTPAWIWPLDGGHQLATILNPSGTYELSVEGAASAGANSSFGLVILNPKGNGTADELVYNNVPTRAGALASISLAQETTDYSLAVDLDNDGTVDTIIQPNSVRTISPDHDFDGAPDSVDRCPGTSSGSIVNSTGCSIDQLVPCAGPSSGGKWKTHGDYVSAVAKAADKFLAAGLITQAHKDAIVAEAARSNCGVKK